MTRIVSSHLVAKVRELGFTYRNQRPRVLVYRRGEDGKTLLIRRSTTIPIAEVRALLFSAGCSEDDVEAFLRAAETVP
jgi:hypothetical protein